MLKVSKQFSKQVEVAFNAFKDAMKAFTEGRKIAGAEGNGQEWFVLPIEQRHSSYFLGYIVPEITG